MNAHGTDDWLGALRRVVGDEHVLEGGPDLALAETATFRTTSRLTAIVRPGDREQVQGCVRVAGAHKVPFYPVSGGKNWGYGSRVPPGDGCFLLDLRRLDRITDHDEELGCVTVEAGVSQRQLHDFLRARGSRLWVDTVTSSPHASIVGNALERGHGLTPYADHVAHIAAMDVVLPTGACVTTGHGQFPGSRVGGLDRWGVGPSLDGLFSQSNLGVVTRLTLWLMHAPEHVEVGMMVLDGDEQLESVIDALRPLRLDGTLRVGPQIWNDYRTVQRGMGFPWEETGGATPLAPRLARAHAEALGGGAYTGVMALYGERGVVDAQRRRVLAALEGRTRRVSFAGAAEIERDPPTSARRRIYSYMTGGVESMDFGVARAYWRKRRAAPRPADLDRDRCGFIWHAPMAPLRGRDARRVTEIAREVILRHGFEPDVAMVAVRERVLHFHISIIYDREVPSEDDGAMACSDELGKRLSDEGYLPARLGVHTMPLFDRVGLETAALLRRLKTMFDPDHLLAPGRYEPHDR